MKFITLGEGILSLHGPRVEVDASLVLGVGGAELNTAIGLARLGHDATWISRVPTGVFGDIVLSGAARDGVRVDLVDRDGSGRVGLSIRDYDDGVSPTFAYYRENTSWRDIALSTAARERIRKAGHLHLTGIPLFLGAASRDAALEALDIARSASVPISFDPNYRAALASESEAREAYEAVLPAVTQLLCNANEARIMTGLGGEAAWRKLAQPGRDAVIVKRGAQGAVAWVGGRWHQVPPEPLTPSVDPVGAGDAFNAGWLHARAIGWPVADALRFAAYTAAAVVKEAGDHAGFPTRQQADQWGALALRKERTDHD